ncbi:MAG: DNA mismatch repair endonuclease MutL [Saprospiraceae bacterium]|nr:DNA mismatch repair endonuclease MutL [Saprospiraceae bacterium]
MSDLIKLLPDSIASQIAAGEVIQRPASVVKELLENSVDAKADEITLVLKDSGKTLIQVSDNGTGMSDTDARMCFERHATSKISTVQDIFKISTKGFRGEALASIAAISQVEMITRDDGRDLGTRILIDGSVVKKQEMIQSETGTRISVKNLFFNIPARRKFLKTEAVEWKHITEEFIRVALAHPEVSFNLHHNGNTIYQLPKSNVRHRVLSIAGKGLDSKILPLDEEMELFKVRGFIGNMDLLQKTRNNQYLFVNKRFIKSNYLNHAITSAYGEFNMYGEFPFYVLYIDINPSLIDINVHPTKQEIKFEEEKLVYNYLKVAIKHVIGKNIFVPKIEFQEDLTFKKMQSGNSESKGTAVNFGSKLNEKVFSSGKSQDWEKVYELVKSKRDTFTGIPDPALGIELTHSNQEEEYLRENKLNDPGKILQVFNNYLLYEQNQKLVVINIKAAVARINYERIYSTLEKSIAQSKKQLVFPITIKLQENNNILNDEFVKELRNYGFDCEIITNKLLVKAVPEYVDDDNLKELVETCLNSYISDIDFRYAFIEKFAIKASSARKVDTGRLDDQEKVYLLKNLLSTKNSAFGPGGEKIFIEIGDQEFSKLINS